MTVAGRLFPFLSLFAKNMSDKPTPAPQVDRITTKMESMWIWKTRRRRRKSGPEPVTPRDVVEFILDSIQTIYILAT